MENAPLNSNASNDQQDIEVVNKPRILVIDDSRLVRVSLQKILAHKFDIVEAEDGEAGWLQIQKYPDLHVVLTDAGMPKLDGFGLIERVRASSNKRIAALPLVMITGAEEGQTKIRERAFDLGASDFIIKPFDKTQLVARVSSYIHQDNLQRDLDMTAQTLKERSTIDPLTKLPNLAFFNERFEKELALAKRHNHELSLISFSIDSIDTIERKFGNDTVQQLLIWLVEQLQPMIRMEDSLTRTGVAEFSLITPVTDRMSAAYVCERLRSKIEQTPYDRTVISLPVTISLGLLSAGKDKPKSAEHALIDIRQRIARAQDLGGNRLIAQSALDIAAPEPVAPVAAAVSASAAETLEIPADATPETTPEIIDEAITETTPETEISLAVEPVETVDTEFSLQAEAPEPELAPQAEPVVVMETPAIGIEPETLQALKVADLDLLNMAISMLPVLKQVSKALNLDVNQQLELIENKLQHRKQQI